MDSILSFSTRECSLQGSAPKRRLGLERMRKMSLVRWYKGTMGKWSDSCIVRGSAAGNRRVPARISHKVIFIELQCLSIVVVVSKHQADLAAGKVFNSAALREEHFRISQSL